MKDHHATNFHLSFFTSGNGCEIPDATGDATKMTAHVQDTVQREAVAVIAGPVEPTVLV